MMLQTEYDFCLPRGYADSDGTLHRAGKMRLATAADEILPLRDPRVKENPEYLIILILARVVTSLGTVKQLGEAVIEGLFVQDLAYLQDLYNRVNQTESPCYEEHCPVCGEKVSIPVNFLRAGR
ncbi:MAG: phage tail assembly protein [Oscillospiraceae bacterium]|jgi:hypothetical protein|nr:phage tail assembly protein [Oscillospiraceae bacterium]